MNKANKKLVPWEFKLKTLRTLRMDKKMEIHFKLWGIDLKV